MQKVENYLFVAHCVLSRSRWSRYYKIQQAGFQISKAEEIISRYLLI